MSLRGRLLVFMAAALAATLAAGGIVAWIGATRGVEAELRAALDVARRTLETTASGHPDPRGLLESFRGSRHLRAALLDGEGRALAPVVSPVAEVGRFPPMPQGFVRLLRPDDLPVLRLPLGPDGGRWLEIEADPANEAREAWDDLVRVLLTLSLFAALAMSWVARALASALRPLERLAVGFGRIGAGDFTALGLARTASAPEIARLCDGFDDMAARLAAAEARSNRLHDAMASLRDRERAAIARDLHDEIGPWLFAIGVDAAQLQRGAGPGAAEAGRNIAEAVGHAQRAVRALLGRLRPDAPVELGLAPALEALLGFWRRSRPDIAWELAIAACDEGLGREGAETAYRVVQEAVTNALRHGQARRIRIAAWREEESLLIEVEDDGGGAPAGTERGLGLRGMAERIALLGGSFDWTSEPRRGVRVRCALPLRGAMAEAALS